MAASRPTVDIASLKKALCDAIDLYLTKDNREPDANTGFFAKAAAAAVSLYSRKGETGRKRAVEYKCSIENNNESLSALLVRVTDDIKRGDSCLGTSNVLRNRLSAALCKVYEINQNVIKAKFDDIRSAAISAVTFAGAQSFAPIPSNDVLWRSAIMALLSCHIAAAQAELNIEKDRAAAAARVAKSTENRSLIGNSSL